MQRILNTNLRNKHFKLMTNKKTLKQLQTLKRKIAGHPELIDKKMNGNHTK